MSKSEVQVASKVAQDEDWHPALVMSQELGDADKFSGSDDDDEDEGAALILLVRDGLDMPIEGLRLYFTFPWGEQATGKTPSHGALAIPLPDANRKGQVKVEVQDAKNQKQQIGTVDLTQCKNPIIISSQKVKTDVSLRQHEQTPPKLPPKGAQPLAQRDNAQKISPATPENPWWIETKSVNKAWDWLRHMVGSDNKGESSSRATKAVVAQGLDQSGHPVTVVVGPEGPNKDNLRMGRNNVYRDIILSASKRLGLIPQSLCALIDCEAGKITEWIDLIGPDGKALLDKKGKPRKQKITQLWKADSKNKKGSAAGMTQFLAGTWLTHVMHPGFYIHEQSIKRGWIRQEEVPQRGIKGKIKSAAGVKPKMQWVFVLANGKTTTTPANFASDANVQKCLQMRMTPEWSINASADYGAFNLKRLEGRRYKLTGMNDMERAKLMYLFHHEGDDAGFRFIDKKLSEVKGGLAGLRATFDRQLDSSAVAKLVKNADGDVEVAYRGWLAKYMDDRFLESSKYFISTPLVARPLSDLIVAIGGVEV